MVSKETLAVMTSPAVQARLELHGRWWESALFGSTTAEIAADEQARGNSEITVEVVERAIEDFSQYAIKHLFGQQRIDAHVAFCRASKRVLHRELVRAMDENRQNDGRGRAAIDTVVITDGGNSVQAVKTRKRYVRNDLAPMLKLAIEFDRYEALVTGVLNGESLREDPATITVDVESFLDTMIRDPSDVRFDATRVPPGMEQVQIERLDPRSDGMSN